MACHLHPILALVMQLLPALQPPFIFSTWGAVMLAKLRKTAEQF